MFAFLLVFSFFVCLFVFVFVCLFVFHRHINYLLTAKARDSFLLGYTHSAAPAASGLGVLASDTKAPEVAQPSMSPNLLQLLQVLAQLVVQAVGQNLAILPVLHILLSVQEPVWYLVLPGILHDSDHLILCEFSSPLGEVNVLFSQHHMSISPLNTLNVSDGKGYFPLPIDVGIEYSQDVLEFLTMSRETWWQHLQFLTSKI